MNSVQEEHPAVFTGRFSHAFPFFKVVLKSDMLLLLSFRRCQHLNRGYSAFPLFKHGYKIMLDVQTKHVQILKPCSHLF